MSDLKADRNIERFRPRLRAGVRLRTDAATGDHLLLFPEGAVRLNETAHAIVALCDAKHTVAEIFQELTRQFDSDIPADITAGVRHTLHELQRQRLIEYVCDAEYFIPRIARALSILLLPLLLLINSGCGGSSIKADAKENAAPASSPGGASPAPSAAPLE